MLASGQAQQDRKYLVQTGFCRTTQCNGERGQRLLANILSESATPIVSQPTFLKPQKSLNALRCAKISH